IEEDGPARTAATATAHDSSRRTATATSIDRAAARKEDSRGRSQVHGAATAATCIATAGLAAAAAAHEGQCADIPVDAAANAAYQDGADTSAPSCTAVPAATTAGVVVGIRLGITSGARSTGRWWMSSRAGH